MSAIASCSVSRSHPRVEQAMSYGYRNTDIGTSLGLAAETVKTDARRPDCKLDAVDRAQAVGMRYGLLLDLPAYDDDDRPCLGPLRGCG